MRAARASRSSAREIALRMLARRDYSRTELAQKLRARRVSPADIESTLDDFERLGYLSDARYAQALVGQRAGRLSRRAIARELQDKGIGPETAKDALAALVPRDELADATAVWERRFGRAPVDDRDKARQLRFIVSRGYSASIAFKVLRATGVPGDDG